ncbi:hypothetical protein IC608_02975 [Devosia sp. PTR5]|uniref:Secreted protein n=1 Tax=Devosia oryzisoli TaxID=2774138 RepID=A0A927FQL1_9HYPH|nr:hypothetical protein [Devosia oryzisoli]MBD8064435.1 hypothetical protein [Devosia oryzisoli]
MNKLQYVSKTFGGVAAIAVFLIASPVLAACPAPAAGDSAQMTAENHARLLCQQRELYEASRNIQLQLQIEETRRMLDNLILQRKLDMVTQPVVPIRIP